MSEPNKRALAAARRTLTRYGPLVLLDALAVLIAYGLALLLRFEWRIPSYYLQRFLHAVWILITAHCTANAAWGLYRRLWRYAGAQEAIVIAAAGATTSSAACLFELLMPGRRPIPLSVLVIGGIFSIGAFAIVRYYRPLLDALLGRVKGAIYSPGRRVLIVGAGEAGQLLARQLLHPDRRRDYELMGFVDDDPRKQGFRLHGLAVLGTREDIPQLTRRLRVDLIIIAIHRISGPEFRKILSICQQTEAQIKVLPDVLTLLKQPPGAGRDAYLPVRDVEPRDLLGRQEVMVDEAACRSLLEGRVALVTGACGSIGSELCRQIMRFSPQKLLAVDRHEMGLYGLQMELEAPGNRSARSRGQVDYVLADVTDRSRMEALIANERPDIIFHAAAYKQVPLMEAHPQEAVRVNVGGTRILCELAERCGVERFVLISTDKAVWPTGVMGLSKRIGELLILALDSSSATHFTAVRFGNVLGSQGSVVPAFAYQIARGGPVTVTDERMTRYFMTPMEAVSLILQAARLTRGGDIFLLDMGQEIRIVDLAKHMIRLKGLRVGKDIEIVYTGVRPGEKLQEEFVHEEFEEQEPTSHPSISRLRTRKRPPLPELLAQIDHLEQVARHGNRNTVVAEMRELVAGFNRALT